MSAIYYVYAYLREDGSPYYIGKGKGQRAYSKDHTIHLPKNTSLIVFLEMQLTNVGACALERRYIEWYGRKDLGTGILRNLTDGGDGNSGTRSLKWRKNHSIKLTGKPMQEHVKQLMRELNRSYMQTNEYKNKISEANKRPSSCIGCHKEEIPCRLPRQHARCFKAFLKASL